MKIDKAISVWKDKISSLLSYYNDSIVIYYKPVRSGTAPTYDAFFNEAVDSTDPDDVGVTETTPSSVTVNGKFHIDLYNKFVSGANDDQQISIGIFEQSDAVFTCLYSDVVIDQIIGETYFNNALYIHSNKDKGRYEIVAVKKRGFTDVYLVDVFLKKTNK